MAQLSRPKRHDGVDRIGGPATAFLPSTALPSVALQHLDTPERRRHELLQGLREEPARISPKFFYDPQGAALYEALCLLPEYYPPRLEAAIFDRHQHAIAAVLPRGSEWVDLGCGDGAKAARWIALLGVRRYLGVDIAQPWLAQTLQRGAQRFPQVDFAGVATDFTRGLDLAAHLDDRLPRVFFYPGSSIGNFDAPQALRLLREVRAHLRPADRLLIGVDAPKPLSLLLPAYDDALGITAAFNLNVLRVVNGELGSDFRPQDFLHRAVFDEAHSRIEMHLVARHDVTVRLAEGLSRVFRAGEPIVTEHSHKHTPQAFEALLSAAGFGEIRHWTDDTAGYGVYVAGPAGAVQ